jgi:hypothetical protein
MKRADIKKKRIKRVSKYLEKNGLILMIGMLLIIASFLSGILVEKTNRIKTEDVIVGSDSQVAKISENELNSIQRKVLKDKYLINVKWGDLGKRMVDDGVIDKTKLAQAITSKNELPKDLDKYFTEDQNKIEVNSQNAGFWVDVLWGLGLANKNKILDEGEMVRDGDASGFASTAGWTLGVNEPMSYYSKFLYINLDDKQQEKVKEIAGNIFRPCCGNSTAFPDCNHGMAMLGLIELMISQGKSDGEIYKAALALNTYWFPETYLQAAYYLEKNGQDYSKTSAKELLSEKYSSAMREEEISKESQGVSWPALGSGGSCGA